MSNSINLVNWSNIDLNSSCERSLNILEPYDFDTLLLEVSCNIRSEDLCVEVIKNHAMQSLMAKHREAVQVLSDNIQNITDKAIAESMEI